MLHMAQRSNISYRLLPIQCGILVTLALVPVWFRFRGSPGPFDLLYTTGFLIFWPMLWTVAWWLVMGLPGFRALLQDKIRCLWALSLLLLVCWAFLSWSWSYTREFSPQVTIGAALPLGCVALFAVTVACAAPPTRVIVAVLVISLLLNGVVGGWQVARQGAISNGFLGEFNIDPNRSGVSVVQADSVRWLRPYGFLPHPNMLAGFLATGLLASLTWVFSDQRYMRWIGISVFLFGLWVLLLTFSRSAWLGFAAGGFAITPFLWPRFRQKILRRFVIILSGLVIGAAVLFSIIYLPFLSARAGIDGESIEIRSVSDRAVYTEMAYRAIGESPLLGVGIGNFPWRASYYLQFTDYDLQGQPVHHIFLLSWAELGFVGYVLTVLVLIFGIEATLQAANSGGLSQTSSLSINQIGRATLLGGVIALMVIGLFDHYPWTQIQFQTLWFGLLAVTGRPESPIQTKADS